jgi:hypothetical protein
MNRVHISTPFNFDLLNEESPEPEIEKREANNEYPVSGNLNHIMRFADFLRISLIFSLNSEDF